MEIELPDFDKIFELIDRLGNLNREIMVLELEIELGEARAITEVTVNPKYFIRGKSPTISYINGTYKITGLEGELIPLRKELLDKRYTYDNLKTELDMYKKMIDVWRTNSANERSSIL